MKLAPDLHHALRMKIAGPWPFITFRSYSLAGRHFTWLSRQHRKGLAREARGLEHAAVPFWQTEAYNWYTGAFFAVGSFLFMLGSFLSILPAEIASASTRTINIVFFLGSVPFTIAGYLQHFQTANAAPFSVDPTAATPPARVSLIGWRPGSVDWLSSFSQFVGTVAFNFNTFDALVASPDWVRQDFEIWVPGMIGSILFLVSGYLAFIETSSGYWSWKPRELAWQIVFVNLLGCVAFMIASTLAFVPAGGEAWWIPDLANIGLLLGGLGFLIGALLMTRESASAAPG
ncbi:hypothetical protein K32_46890 [Kaistia sp. 32K]|uniref:hypothetical protein n=1 Tax=Kaistia sp. 32K TaxID=2795690 RepID=UPI001916C2E7|nr:hypothetical protein [Kaistia sp. 32K]BCP56072.1 hypothetical protein K32_46890 [Kaistia sp. 32K]